MATLAEIRAEARILADCESELDRHPNAQIDRHINRGLKRIFAILVKHSLIVDEATQTISADGSLAYALPADHFATIGVFDPEGCKVPRHRRQDGPHGVVTIPNDGQQVSYRTAVIAGAKSMELKPTPSSGDYSHSYIPMPSELVQDTDSTSYPMGWDDFAATYAAIKCRRKDNESSASLEKDLLQLKSDIMDEAEQVEKVASLKILSTRQLTEVDDYFD